VSSCRPAESLWFQIEKDGKLRFLAHSPNWPPAGLTGGYEVNHEIPYWNGRIFHRTYHGTVVCFDLRPGK
jgi:hypothetical protein